MRCTEEDCRFSSLSCIKLDGEIIISRLHPKNACESSEGRIIIFNMELLEKIEMMEYTKSNQTCKMSQANDTNMHAQHICVDMEN